MENSWPNPYLKGIDRAKKLIKQAKRSISLPTEFFLTLFDAKKQLDEIVSSTGDQNTMSRISTDNRIAILAEIVKSDKVSEIQKIAEKFLAEPFHLNALLAISRLLIDGTTITGRQQILAMYK